MKKASAIGVLALMISGILFAQSAAPENAVVEGTVQRLDSTEVVAGAAVELRPTRGSDALVVVADEAGRFSFKDVPAGEYTLAATHPGYVRAEYGQRKLNGPGIKITIKAGQEMKAVVFSLAATGVICGQVRGLKGLPTANVQVHALKYGYEDGRRVLQTIRTVRTDDEGDYRLYWLPPGQYIIMAIPLLGDVEKTLLIVGADGTASGIRTLQTASGAPIVLPDETGSTPFYYPGTVRIDEATLVALKPGEERTSMDLNVLTVSSAHVRGIVTNLPPVTGGNAAGPPTLASVRLEPTLPSVLERKTAPLNRSAVDLQTGAFDIRGVLPGRYNLLATAAAGGRDRTVVFARIPVEVIGSDIDNLRVPLAPGFTVTVRVHVDGVADNATEIATLPPLRVALNGNIAQPDPSKQPGVFVARQLAPDVYRVRVEPLTNGYVKSVRYGDMDILETGLQLNSAPASPIEIAISLSAGVITGSVRGRDGKSAVNSAVVLVPEQSRRQQSLLYKNVSSGVDGTFRITGIAPGDYKLFSWVDVDTGAWQDPDFIKDYEELGQSIHIGEGSAASVEVTAIP